jgi:hypothetical protein
MELSSLLVLRLTKELAQALEKRKELLVDLTLTI